MAFPPASGQSSVTANLAVNTVLNVSSLAGHTMTKLYNNDPNNPIYYGDVATLSVANGIPVGGGMESAWIPGTDAVGVISAAGGFPVRVFEKA